MLEWDEADGGSFDDLRRILFPHGPPKRRTLAELKEGIRRHVRKRHARLDTNVLVRLITGDWVLSTVYGHSATAIASAEVLLNHTHLRFKMRMS